MITFELECDSRSHLYPSSTTHDTARLVAWLKTQCSARAQEREASRRMERLYASHAAQMTKVLFALLSFVALLTFVTLGVRQTPDPASFALMTFLGLIAAGATGALVRSIFWGAEETLPISSLVLGGIAGFVVGLAYLIPQWVGAPGVLAP